jgi:lysophospholipase L1-like esterase
VIATYATSREATDPYCLRDGEAARLLADHPWRRFAVIGDSMAEGVNSPNAEPTDDGLVGGIFEPSDGYLARTWVDRIADELTAAAPSLVYDNYAIRYLRADQVRDGQLDRAVAFRPDLALVACGSNDAISPRYSADLVDAELTVMIRALQDAGAVVLTVGALVLDEYPGLHRAIRAGVPRRLRALRARTAILGETLGTVHIDLSDHPSQQGTDLMASDGLHGSGRSHAIAAAVAIRRLGAHLGRP